MNKSISARWLMVALGLSGCAAPGMALQEFDGWLREQFLSPYKQAAEAGDPADLFRHPIDDFGTCSFFAKRGVRWHQDFNDGSRLELRCEPDRGSMLPGFRLLYLKPGQSRFEIGRCIFDQGFNQGWYYTSRDPNFKGLVRVEWVSVDGGKNDGGGRRLDRDHVTGPEEPYVDVVHWTFDARLQRMECISDKYQYTASSLRLPDRPQPLEEYMGEPVLELRRSFVKFAQ